MTHGCSGGGGTDNPTPTPDATASPTPIPAPTPTPVPETIQSIGTVSESDVASVGKLATRSGAAASGVLIAPQYILTAAHNVAYDDRTIKRPFNIIIGGNTYTISTDAQVRVNPNYDGVDFHGGDIAVVKLDTPVTGITPATRYSGTEEIGKQVVHKGFGIHKNPSPDGSKVGYNVIDGTADQLNGLGFKTVVSPQTVITNATPLCLITDYDDGSATGNSLSAIGSASNPMSNELVVTSGDSGGGLFVRTNNGLRLVGIAIDLAIHDSVTSAGIETESYYGRVSSYSRISAYKDWINTQISN